MRWWTGTIPDPLRRRKLMASGAERHATDYQRRVIRRSGWQTPACSGYRAPARPGPARPGRRGRGDCSEPVPKPTRPGRDVAMLDPHPTHALPDVPLPRIEGPPGLRHACDGTPGITRRRRGRGFSYHDASGAPIADAGTLARIRALAIPPAWTDVWICPHASGHVQATGRDQRGRKQYRYHDDWHAHRDALKFARLPEFAQS